MLYLSNPEKPEKFSLTGNDLLPILKEREKVKRAEFEKYRKKTEIVN
jgi:hypothetical protein